MLRKSWILVAVVAVAAAWILFGMLRGGGDVLAPPAATTAVPPPPPAPPASSPAPRATGAVAPLRQDPASPTRTMPYRPAKLLRYSDGIPSVNPADDDRSPILARILAVAQATPPQEARIRQLWRVHEDGRRALLAEAHPPSIGPPVLDPGQLAALDGSFDAALMNETLNAAQRQRLSLEMAPRPANPGGP